jgi:hypothetical protein
MLKKIVFGDITSPTNKADIIIGMNSQMKDVRGIGFPFVKRLQIKQPINLGSVISFEFKQGRQLHMIVCHHIGADGWVGADMHVRFGMDYLWQQPETHMRDHSIVQIGNGRAGQRDGANTGAILSAMANSFLPVTLFVFTPVKEEADASVVTLRPRNHAIRVWHPLHGEERVTVAT